ncbi:glycosyltransferase family 4 protein [Engelhardtia mirabilis]|uniref:2-deoxystreptamine glucosyltransferase n=1 Tax=Engelhardtia mirabilis TaxID=2528011 RepID=A0A518BK83_9BACT|nr:2-deoxystreptamine glucosyltransferase [Planctomycetes bacterium Pla133]QDV01704.1 2-deoxystreptamine glucosyltransferase [Planctomycetes bacterium Pla86]
MRLLLLTQVLDRDDAVLGFVVRWIEGLANHVEQVRVVALEVGETRGLPQNVDWREIGRKGRVRRYLRYKRVLREALLDDGFDAVLAHMVPRYALVARGPARRAGAGLFLWYTHAGVDARLRKAVGVVDKVFTASPESLRLDPPNKVVTGHGIDLVHFPMAADAPAPPQRIVSVGRLTPAKDPLTIIEALAQLRAEGRDVVLQLVGAGLASGDDEYALRVDARIAELGLGDAVERTGKVPYTQIASVYAGASLLVNSSHTGSVDKVVLEAMATGRPVLSCNDSFDHVFRSLGARAQALRFAPGDVRGLVERARFLLDLAEPQRAELGRALRAIVEDEHEVEALMANLVLEMGGGSDW